MEFGYFTLSDNHYETTPARRTSSSTTSPPKRSMPTSSACIRPGSASIISIRSACFPVRIWCSPISRRAPSISGSRRLSRCCRCIIRSASPSNGRRSTCSAMAASISPPAAATTGANTCRSTSRSRTTRAFSTRASRWCASCGRRTIASTHHGKHYQFEDVRITPKPVQTADPDLCRRRSPSPRSSSPRGSAAG